MAKLAYHNIFIINKLRLLQKANMALNKYRKAKKTRLHQGGAVTTRDAQKELEQKNINKQLKKERNGNGGHGKG